MSLSKESIKRLRAVKAAILAEPDLYDQQLIPRDSCNSPCCLLGWAVWLNSPKEFDRLILKYAQEDEWDTAAVRSLKLQKVLPTYPDMWRLFGSGLTWPKEYSDGLYKAVGHAEKAAVAAARIEHFIKTDGAE